MERKGFTLIELMVVLTIIIIIATASVPRIEIWTARNRGITAVSQIISEFSKAKSIAAYSVFSNTTTLTNGTFQRTRRDTAIIFRTSSFSILQRNDSGVLSPIKQTALPSKVSITSLNSGSTSDFGDSPTLFFTSTGRVKKTDGTVNGSLVPFGAGLGNLNCGSINSPLDGRRIFAAVLKSEINGDHSLWYRIEIDTAGESFVCTETGGSSAPDFQGETANVLEL